MPPKQKNSTNPTTTHWKTTTNLIPIERLGNNDKPGAPVVYDEKRTICCKRDNTCGDCVRLMDDDEASANVGNN